MASCNNWDELVGPARSDLAPLATTQRPTWLSNESQALICWLYGRPLCWPDRQAQGEWDALLV